MKFNPAEKIQDLQYFGEFGGVNPSISDSSTYTFMTAKSMSDTFEGNTDGCYLYSRHTSPSNEFLGRALAEMEATESAQVFASGMAAITATLMQICKAGDHIVSSRTIYGGTYAFLKNFAPQLGIQTSFVDLTDLEKVKAAIQPSTKVIFGESLSNPLLEVADIKRLSEIAQQNQLELVIDNTFTPLCISPKILGASIVIHSLTKFINGSSDTVGGVVCASKDFIDSLRDVNTGAAMLLGQTMDSLRAASILKNLRTLPIRMKKHSENALYLAEKFEHLGIKTVYPGLQSHRGHQKMNHQINASFGCSGMLTINAKSFEKANELMELMQSRNIGYLAVSLGFYKTLFSAPGTSTSSEIPDEEQAEMGLSDGLVRFSVGLDDDIEKTFIKIKHCCQEVGLID
ncbi:MAG: aminotransferase class I/II-fold pyridoxal phosphate-dependent enzyme [Bacteroidota bacterium]